MTTPPLVNPTPKQRFQEDDKRMKAHLELLSNPQLQVSLDAALLQYQHALSHEYKDMAFAAANHFKIAGAVEFLAVFKRIAEQQPPPPKVASGQLNHTA